MRVRTIILVVTLTGLGACLAPPRDEGPALRANRGKRPTAPTTEGSATASTAGAPEAPATAASTSGESEIPAGASAEALPNFDRMWNYQDPAATEVRFRELLDRVECDAGDDYLAQLLSQIARTEGLQRKFDAAHATLDRVESLLPYASAVARARYLLERGRTFNSGGHPEKSVPLFEQALAAAQESEQDVAQFHAVDAAHMLGIVEKGEKSLAWNARAIELAEAATFPPAKNWLRALYNNTGWTYHDMGRVEEAMELWRKQLEMCPDDDANRVTRIARWTLARGMRSQGRYEEALEIQRAQEAWYAEHGGSHGFVEEEIGECLLALGRDDEAGPYFAKAHGLLSEHESWLLEEEPARMARLARLGGVR